MSKTQEHVIEVFDNNDKATGIWHYGPDVAELIDKAEQSVRDVTGQSVTRVVTILEHGAFSAGIAGNKNSAEYHLP